MGRAGLSFHAYSLLYDYTRVLGKKLMKDFLHFEFSSVSFESNGVYVFEHVNYVQTTACSRKV